MSVSSATAPSAFVSAKPLGVRALVEEYKGLVFAGRLPMTGAQRRCLFEGFLSQERGAVDTQYWLPFLIGGGAQLQRGIVASYVRTFGRLSPGAAWYPCTDLEPPNKCLRNAELLRGWWGSWLRRIGLLPARDPGTAPRTPAP